MGTKQTNGHTKNGKQAPEAKPSKAKLEARASEARLEKGSSSKRKLESDRRSKAKLDEG